MSNFLQDIQPLKIPINGVRLPKFEITDKYLKIIGKDVKNSAEFLRELCLTGFKNLKLQKDSLDYKKYADRVKYELDLVNELGFTDYFLLVWDVLHFCREKGI